MLNLLVAPLKLNYVSIACTAEVEATYTGHKRPRKRSAPKRICLVVDILCGVTNGSHWRSFAPPLPVIYVAGSIRWLGIGQMCGDVRARRLGEEFRNSLNAWFVHSGPHRPSRVRPAQESVSDRTRQHRLGGVTAYSVTRR